MFFKIVFITISILILLVVGGLGIGYLTAPDRFNILVVGSDQRGTEAARSDVLMVFSVSKSGDDPISLLTIPRDTRVEVEGHGMQKITHAYGYDRESGSILGNIELTEQTVEELLDIPIHLTAEFTFNSFVDFIDQMGGVTGSDGTTIDGEEALTMVRDRDRAGGDFARASDQRDILKSLLPLVSSKSGIEETIAFFNGHPESRVIIHWKNVAHFGLGYVIGHRSVKPEFNGLEEHVVPGEGGRIYTADFGKELYYWVVEEEELETLMEEHFR